MNDDRKRVLVSGCFDLLHSGHVAFLQEAASRGDLHVCLGTDDNVFMLKGQRPCCPIAERLYMVSALACVTEAFESAGRGLLDFEADLARVQPHIFVVNEDGHDESKRALCTRGGIEYVILPRMPAAGLPARSSSALRGELMEDADRGLPYRLALTGGWIDQPWVSSVCPGSMVVMSLRPTIEFSERSGMATSTRKIAQRIWPERVPDGVPPEDLARILFGAENPPGTEYVSGSQDAIGLMCPGISELHYDGGYWPTRIDSSADPSMIEWLERVIHLVPIGPRPSDYDPLAERHLRPDAVRALGACGRESMEAIRGRDLDRLGRAMNATLAGWRTILPGTVPRHLDPLLAAHDRFPGRVLSGCGGGYLVVAADEEIKGSLSIRVRTA